MATLRRRTNRLAPTGVIIGLLALAVVLAAIGTMYVGLTADRLPKFVPGHVTGLTRHHDKHAMAAFALAALALIGAWIGSAKRKIRWDS
jgi:uncharacterized membrane protein